MRPFAICLMALLACHVTTAAEKAAGIDDINAMVERMSSDDFEEREAATRAAGALPVAWARVLSKLSVGYAKTNPETAARLHSAIVIMFEHQALPKDERWMLAHGKVEFEYNDSWGETWVARLYKILSGEHEENTTSHVMVVVSSWGACDSTLRTWDVITHIDGKTVAEAHEAPLSGWGIFRSGQEYELTVQRPKNPDHISERGSINDTDEFDTIKVRIKAIYDEDPSESPHGVSRHQLSTAGRMAWNDWIVANGLDEEFDQMAMEPGFYQRAECDPPPFRP